MARARILVVDDEKNILSSLSRALEVEGYAAVLASTGEQALERLLTESVDLALVDVKLPGMDGLAVLKAIRRAHAELPVVMMSGHGTIETAVQATKLGARDFIEKPLSSEKVLLTIENILKLEHLERENVALKREVERRYQIVGTSRAVEELNERIKVTAPTTGRVLITGEHGTGKELVAREIHRLSRRRDGPFIKVNCAAIPTELIESELFGHEKGAFTGAIRRRQGKFELADKGTIFLDEIGDMKLEMQAKLLRVLQEGEFERVGSAETLKVDVRVIAATNKDLTHEIAEERFREDLYYRLNVVPFHIPPLRERLADVPALAQHFADLASAENASKPKQLSPAAIRALQTYSWPGNIRELKNIVERLLILVEAPHVSAEDVLAVLPAAADASTVPRSGTLRDIVAAAEKRAILDTLHSHHWHISNAARELGLERSHLYKKMRQHGIERETRLS